MNVDDGFFPELDAVHAVRMCINMWTDIVTQFPTVMLRIFILLLFQWSFFPYPFRFVSFRSFDYDWPSQSHSIEHENSMVRFFELDIQRNTVVVFVMVLSLATAHCGWYDTFFSLSLYYFVCALNGFFYRFQLFVSNVQDKWISMNSILFIVVSSSGLIHRKLQDSVRNSLDDWVCDCE